MSKKFALIAVLGALAAMALPASSMATMWPPNAKFEINGSTSEGTRSLVTPQGSCLLQSIKGTLPADPTKENFYKLEGAPTVSNCTGGVSMVFSGEWKITGSLRPNTNQQLATVIVGPTSFPAVPQVAIRYASLPGCVLSGSFALSGEWTNYILDPPYSFWQLQSIPTPKLTWQNDGSATCAKKGTQTEVTISSGFRTKVTTASGFQPVKVII